MNNSKKPFHRASSILVFAGSTLGFFLRPGFTFFFVGALAVLNAFRIGNFFWNSSKPIGRDFSLMAYAESFVMLMTIAFGVLAFIGVLDSISYENQMRMRIAMAGAAAYSTQRFYERHRR